MADEHKPQQPAELPDKLTDKEFEQWLAGEDELSTIWQADSPDSETIATSDPATDAVILASAKRAVASGPQHAQAQKSKSQQARAKLQRNRRWVVPLSAAAVVTLSIGLVFELQQQPQSWEAMQPETSELVAEADIEAVATQSPATANAKAENESFADASDSRQNASPALPPQRHAPTPAPVQAREALGRSMNSRNDDARDIAAGHSQTSEAQTAEAQTDEAKVAYAPRAIVTAPAPSDLHHQEKAEAARYRERRAEAEHAARAQNSEQAAAKQYRPLQPMAEEEITAGSFAAAPRPPSKPYQDAAGEPAAVSSHGRAEQLEKILELKRQGQEQEAANLWRDFKRDYSITDLPEEQVKMLDTMATRYPEQATE